VRAALSVCHLQVAEGFSLCNTCVVFSTTSNTMTGYTHISVEDGWKKEREYLISFAFTIMEFVWSRTSLYPGQLHDTSTFNTEDGRLLFGNDICLNEPKTHFFHEATAVCLG
jgi:hypothetical protein